MDEASCARKGAGSRDQAPVLIGAHYDTAGDWPGANDNAAAVAIALDAARRLVAAPAARDVVIALFDAEEPPFFQTPIMGSTRFCERQATGPVHAALGTATSSLSPRGPAVRRSRWTRTDRSAGPRYAPASARAASAWR